MEQADCIVIGAGVVGLAVARALALAGREVIILEAERAFGTHTSSRNSEVMHAGIYYLAGSLKARLCVSGSARLYEYCASHQVAHARCGKLLVATDAAQLSALEALGKQGTGNGVRGLTWLDSAQARRLEPALSCEAALLSPDTGILDSHGLMLALLGDAERAGAMLAYDAHVRGGAVTSEGIRLEVGDLAGEGEAMSIMAASVVNCAGLYAHEVAARIDGVPADALPPSYRAKGSYFSYVGRSPFQRLIYPLPERGGLGVHLTLDLAGQARFGPNVEWVEAIDYGVRASDADIFYGAIRRYWPALPDGALTPAYAGVRPKVSGPGDPAGDFRIDDASVHGVPGLVNLFGIESPGLTASLAIADYVAERL